MLQPFRYDQVLEIILPARANSCLQTSTSSECSLVAVFGIPVPYPLNILGFQNTDIKLGI